MAGTARFEWVVETMGIRASDRILEVGAGSSASVAYLAEPLTTGRVVAIDRSATAIARSRKKHAALVDAGRVRLLHLALEELRPEDVRDGDTGFDKVLAVNVNLFWTRDPTPELTLIRELLNPGGALYLVYGYGEPGAGTSSSPKPLPGKLSEHLRGAGFEVRTRASGDLLGIVATPA